MAEALAPLQQLATLFADRDLKPKEKIDALAALIVSGKVAVGEVVTFASTAKDPVKASCIEAIERLASNAPEHVPAAAMDFCIASLSDKAPRIKWESAKVIGHCIHLHPKKVNEAVSALLDNTEHEGTVVRWSAAYALSRIAAMALPLNRTLIPALEAIAVREEKNSIRKIHVAAINATRRAK
ncbi:MAG: hypothetical protein JNM62_12990 [Flavobacteriales bacterium]|nr:hypothetical protein [Flavobacteriales bacterium]